METTIITILLVLLIAQIIVGFIFFKSSKDIHVRNELIDKENERINKINNQLHQEKCQLESEKYALQEVLKELDSQAETLKQQYNTNIQMAEDGFENYCKVLDAAYVKKEIEIDRLIQILSANYDAERLEREDELSELKEELNKVRTTISATISAQQQEEKVKANIDYYCLKLPLQEINDISVLERIKSQLNQPRILSMLIWTTFYRDKLNELCNRLIGNKAVCGIYKITNQVNGKSYIGQSVNVADRWKQHAKKGLGIDQTPTTLYNEMQEYGLYNFSWELLEVCKQEELNEKEKYFIDLYQTDKTGLNSKGGNTK